MQRINLGARVTLSVFNHMPLFPINPPSHQPPLSLDLPLFLLPQVVLLRTDYSLTRSTILRLRELEYGILPNLKCYSFDINSQQAPVDLTDPEILACLRSRSDNGSPFALQYWTPDGKARCDMMFPIYADLDVLQMLVGYILPRH